MRLLWLKVYASSDEDTSFEPARPLDTPDERESSGVVVPERQRVAGGFDEQGAWNVKSTPRTIAPWEGPSARPPGDDAELFADEELALLR